MGIASLFLVFGFHHFLCFFVFLVSLLPKVFVMHFNALTSVYNSFRFLMNMYNIIIDLFWSSTRNFTDL